MDGLQKCVCNFLYNGSKYRTELIPLVIGKLSVLLEHVKDIKDYRFYCSSLLIIYDGDVNSASTEVEVRMIDFSNSLVKNDTSNYHVGPDEGYILGVTSMIELFQNVKKEIESIDSV